MSVVMISIVSLQLISLFLVVGICGSLSSQPLKIAERNAPLYRTALMNIYRRVDDQSLRSYIEEILECHNE